MPQGISHPESPLRGIGLGPLEPQLWVEMARSRVEAASPGAVINIEDAFAATQGGHWTATNGQSRLSALPRSGGRQSDGVPVQFPQHYSSFAPTAHRPTARPSGSSSRHYASEPIGGPTRTPPSVRPPCAAGSTTTTGIALTPVSAVPHHVAFLRKKQPLDASHQVWGFGPPPSRFLRARWGGDTVAEDGCESLRGSECQVAAIGHDPPVAGRPRRNPDQGTYATSAPHVHTVVVRAPTISPSGRRKGCRSATAATGCAAPCAPSGASAAARRS